MQLHLLVGEDAMMCDALFQLGMGPVVLEATQTEETKCMRPCKARNASLRIAVAGMTPFARTMSRAYIRTRGNSAKALITSA